MATLYTVAVGGIVKADDLNQIVLAWTAGTVPLQLTLINDNSYPALEVRNQGSGGAVTVRDTAGNPVFVINSSGLSAAAVPGSSTLYTLVGTTATQTLTNKTLTDAILSGIVKITTGTFSFHKHSPDIAVSGGNTISLTQHGNYAKITTDNLATTVTTLDISSHSSYYQAGSILVLEFAGKLKIVNSGNIKVASTFVAQANAKLVLLYDGTNWYEIGRSGDMKAHSQFYSNTVDQTVLTSTDTTVTLNSENALGGASLFTLSSNTIIPLVAGVYEITGVGAYENSDKDGTRHFWTDLNGTIIQELGSVGTSSVTADDTVVPLATAYVRVNGSTDAIRLRTAQTSGNSLALRNGLDVTQITLRWVGV